MVKEITKKEFEKPNEINYYTVAGIVFIIFSVGLVLAAYENFWGITTTNILALIESGNSLFAFLISSMSFVCAIGISLIIISIYKQGNYGKLNMNLAFIVGSGLLGLAIIMSTFYFINEIFNPLLPMIISIVGAIAFGYGVHLNKIENKSREKLKKSKYD